jgi:hypothetical protein
MPVFEPADEENPPLHMDGWDDDELVYLKPHLSYLIEQRARGKAVVWPEGMTGEQLRALPPDELERLLAECTDPSRVDEELLLSMIERWTLRRHPTKAQREKGERGDVMPLTREAIRQLPPAVGQFIRAEIEQRRDIVPQTALVGPAGDDFRGSVPVPGDGRLPEQGGSAGAANGAGGGSSGENRMDARPSRRLSRGAT